MFFLYFLECDPTANAKKYQSYQNLPRYASAAMKSSSGVQGIGAGLTFLKPGQQQFLRSMLCTTDNPVSQASTAAPSHSLPTSASNSSSASSLKINPRWSFSSSLVGNVVPSTTIQPDQVVSRFNSRRSLQYHNSMMPILTHYSSTTAM